MFLAVRRLGAERKKEYEQQHKPEHGIFIGTYEVVAEAGTIYNKMSETKREELTQMANIVSGIILEKSLAYMKSHCASCGDYIPHDHDHNHGN
jgi:hypothetical protein